MSNQEVKGNLAKLLATENLVVEHRVCDTAQFDVERRVLTLPIWDCSDRVYNMLVGHEVGHALYTPNEDWSKEYDIPKSYVNVTEDARIEKLMKRKFPGLSKDFFQAYQQLNDKDFFEIKDENLEELNLIDRINLYFKIGSYSIMPFIDSELPLRDAVGAAETFQEAIEAARAVYAYEKAVQETQNLPSFGDEDNNEEISIDKTEGDSVGPSDQGEKEGDAKPNGQDSNSKENNEGEGKPQGQGGEDTPQKSKEGGRSADLESKTAKSFAEAVEEMAQKHSHYDPVYMEIDNVDLKHHIVSPHRIHELNNEYWTSDRYTNVEDTCYINLDFTEIDNEYRQWKRTSSREVNYLAKEFEMKKSAAAYSRESVARTGVLDTAKLHTYRFNEDIFKKITVKPDGKNHGLIFILDWSGSMADCIHDTYKQLLSLCLFCRKVGIPFDVYTFVQEGHFYPENWDNSTKEEGRENTLHIPNNFFMPNILNSKLNNKQFDTYARDIWRITTMFNYRYGYRYPRWQSEEWEKAQSIPDAIPYHMQLGGTPLCEAIGCLQTIIPDFKARNNVEKCHVTILSDGEAAHAGMWLKRQWDGDESIFRGSVRYHTQIRDRKNGRVYKYQESSPFTKQLLEYLKGKFPSTNFLGFRLTSLRDFKRILEREYGPFHYGMDDAHRSSAQAKVDKVVSGWRKDKCVSAQVLGFQEIYFLESKSLNTEVEFEPKSDSKADIKRAFTKSLKGKSNNKKILSAFIDQIA